MYWTKKVGWKQVGRKQVGRKLGTRVLIVPKWHKNVFTFIRYFKGFRAVWMSSRRSVYDCMLYTSVYDCMLIGTSFAWFTRYKEIFQIHSEISISKYAYKMAIHMNVKVILSFAIRRRFIILHYTAYLSELLWGV